MMPTRGHAAGTVLPIIEWTEANNPVVVAGPGWNNDDPMPLIGAEWVPADPPSEDPAPEASTVYTAVTYSAAPVAAPVDEPEPASAVQDLARRIKASQTATLAAAAELTPDRPAQPWPTTAPFAFRQRVIDPRTGNLLTVIDCYVTDCWYVKFEEIGGVHTANTFLSTPIPAAAPAPSPDPQPPWFDRQDIEDAISDALSHLSLNADDLGRAAGDVYRTLAAAGSPEPPSREQIAQVLRDYDDAHQGAVDVYEESADAVLALFAAAGSPEPGDDGTGLPPEVIRAARDYWVRYRDGVPHVPSQTGAPVHIAIDVLNAALGEGRP